LVLNGLLELGELGYWLSITCSSGLLIGWKEDAGVDGEMAKRANLKHRKFVANILKGMTHAAAYTGAGYKAKNVFVASTCAGELLKKPEIIEALDKGEKKIHAEIESLLLENARNAAIKLGQLIDSSTPSVMASSSRDALDRVGYKPVDKQEITGSQEVNIDIKLPEGISLDDV
jgi:hypothetical protein